MRLLGQGEGDVGISGSGAHFAAAASDDDILFAVGEVGGGGGVASGGEFGFPEFLAIGLVKGAEVFVFGCPDEEEAACGGDGAAIVFSSGGWDTLGREFGEFAQGDRPEVFARVQIDGIEGSPRGFDGGVAIGIEEAVIACMGEGDDAEGLAPGGGFLGGIRCFVAIDEGYDTFSLALAEEGEEGMMPFPVSSWSRASCLGRRCWTPSRDGMVRVGSPEKSMPWQAAQSWL